MDSNRKQLDNCNRREKLLRRTLKRIGSVEDRDPFIRALQKVQRDRATIVESIMGR